MPSPKMLAYMAGVSLLVVLGLEKYRTSKAR